MRISSHVIAFFFGFNHNTRIHPTNTHNTHIFHYTKTYDIYRYKSNSRKKLKNAKGYTGIVQDHHIIPKQFINHPLITQTMYDIHSSNNLLIMPTDKAFMTLNLHPNIRTHFMGHNKYNSYVRLVLDEINAQSASDLKKYSLWLFYHHLKFNLPYFVDTIPWT